LRQFAGKTQEHPVLVADRRQRAVAEQNRPAAAGRSLFRSAITGLTMQAAVPQFGSGLKERL
jgi:uncharacterized protein (DUF2345 family)